MWTTCGKAVKNHVDRMCTVEINHSFVKNTKKFSHLLPHVNFMVSTIFSKACNAYIHWACGTFPLYPKPYYGEDGKSIIYLSIYRRAKGVIHRYENHMQ